MKASPIKRIPTERATLLAFKVSGKITKASIEWMANEVKAAFSTVGTIDILIIIVLWDGIELGAVFDKKSLSAQGQASMHVRKYGVVGAPTWAKTMINLFSPLTPVEEKTFELRDVDQAWAWIDNS